MLYIAHAATRGMYWRGRSIWLGSGTTHTNGWVKWRYSQVPEIQYLPRILNVVRLIWRHSQFYNTADRLAGLLRKVSTAL